MIKSLCSMNACRHELEQITGGSFQSRRPPREHMTGFHSNHSCTPSKIMRGNGGYRGASFTNSDGYGRSGGDGFGSNNSGYAGYNRGGYNNRGYVPRGRRGNWSGRGIGGGGGFRGRY